VQVKWIIRIGEQVRDLFPKITNVVPYLLILAERA